MTGRMKYLFTLPFCKFMRHYLILKSQEKYSFEGKQLLDLDFVVLHQGLHSLSKYLLKGFEYTKG